MIQCPKIIKTFLPQLSTIWVSCEGENPADVDHIGVISYYPNRGLPGYYFPYQKQEGYLSPLVALHFERPVRK
jgi:sodium/potassium-transporting ATPase subunit beta